MKSFLSILALLAATQAHAGGVALRIVDSNGAPVPDAVVQVRPAAGVPGGPIRFPWGTRLAQRNIQFEPHVLIVPVGASVSFPNFDKVRHHVYSFSKPARFEIKLFGRDESRFYTFRSPGTVAVGCNIHDTMSAFIKVVDTPFANRTDGTGLVRISGISGGKAKLFVWHPRLRARDNELAFDIDVPANGEFSRRLPVALR